MSEINSENKTHSTPTTKSQFNSAIHKVTKINDFIIKSKPKKSNVVAALDLSSSEPAPPEAPNIEEVKLGLKKVKDQKQVDNNSAVVFNQFNSISSEALVGNNVDKTTKEKVVSLKDDFEVFKKTNFPELKKILKIKNPATSSKINLHESQKITGKIQKSVKLSRFSWVMLISLVIFAALISVFVGSMLISSVQKRLESGDKYMRECQNELNAAQRKGLEINGFICANLSLWDKLIYSSKNLQELQNLKDSLTRQEAELLSQIKAYNQKISKTEEALTFLNVEFEKQASNEQELINTPYPEILNIRKNRLETLTVLISGNQALISNMLNEMKIMLDKNPKLATEELRKDVENYGYLSLEDRALELVEFNKKYKRFRNIVIANDGIYQPLSDSTRAELADPYFLFNNIQYGEVKLILPTEIGITGDDKTDAYIYKLAEKRGYRLQLQADELVLFSSGDFKLQPKAMQDWEEMKAAAERDGVKLKLSSGYRSVQDQVRLFQERLNRQMKIDEGKVLTNSQILKGEADEILNKVMDITSPPGYSQHHSGYAVDINDDSEAAQGEAFENTEGFKWLSANNFENAKKFGFINPYYWQDIAMGPQREAWHFMWVGVENLKY